jgi:hypothetical protein
MVCYSTSLLTWDLIYPCHNFKIKNYLMQHVTILKITKKHFTKNVLINFILFTKTMQVAY